MLKLQRLSLFFLRRMQGANAFEDFAHHRRLGRISKALAVVPLRQRRQTQLQRVDRQLTGMRHQITRHAIAGGWQEPAPTHFKMLNGCPIAAPGVITGGRLQIEIQISHQLKPRKRTAMPLETA